jgi:hypothetical protein
MLSISMEFELSLALNVFMFGHSNFGGYIYLRMVNERKLETASFKGASC